MLLYLYKNISAAILHLLHRPAGDPTPTGKFTQNLVPRGRNTVQCQPIGKLTLILFSLNIQKKKLQLLNHPHWDFWAEDNRISTSIWISIKIFISTEGKPLPGL